LDSALKDRPPVDDDRLSVQACPAPCPHLRFRAPPWYADLEQLASGYDATLAARERFSLAHRGVIPT
jgi:hypothetical protein